MQVCNILNPNSADNIKQMARSLFLLGRHKLAIEAYRQAEQRAEQPDWEVNHNLGVCHLYLREWEEAGEQLRQALQHSRHEESYVVLGKLHLLTSDVTGAVEVYREAVRNYILLHSIYCRSILVQVRAFPDSPELNTTLGLLHIQTGNHQVVIQQSLYMCTLCVAGSLRVSWNRARLPARQRPRHSGRRLHDADTPGLINS